MHDDASYVPKELFEEWAKRDPIERFRTWLRENAELTDDEEDEIAAEVKQLLNDALRRAEETPAARPGDARSRASTPTPEDLDTPHHKYADGREDVPPGDLRRAPRRRCGATSACS